MFRQTVEVWLSLLGREGRQREQQGGWVAGRGNVETLNWKRTQEEFERKL